MKQRRPKSINRLPLEGLEYVIASTLFQGENLSMVQIKETIEEKIGLAVSLNSIYSVTARLESRKTICKVRYFPDDARRSRWIWLIFITKKGKAEVEETTRLHAKLLT